MFKNYLKITLRSIRRHKGYSAINILGLAIGMACCILILVYVQNELGYDAFHEKADRIYRIAEEEDHDGRRLDYVRIGGGVTTRMLTDFPDIVEKRTRLLPAGEIWIRIGEELYREDRVFLSDPTFFDVFSFKLLMGDPEAALKSPNSVVISKSSADKYFGNDNALGQMIRADVPGTPLIKVTGVVEDQPDNSHFHFDVLISLSTIVNDQNRAGLEAMYGNTFYSYILIRENYPAKSMESQLPAFLEKHLNENQKKRVKRLFLQPLKDIHLHSHTFTEIETNGNIAHVYIFSAVAILILVIACINFMNLATARSANRAKEVGLRKVVGATRQKLMKQFIGESLFLSIIIFPLAIALSEFFLIVFNSLTEKNLSISYFSNALVFLGLLGIILFVGLFSGSYPAFFLSAFKPVDVLKGKLTAGSKSAVLRKILVVTQFTVSIGFVVVAVIILQQMNFVMNTDLGFNKDQVVVIPVLLPLPNAMRVNTMEYLKKEYLKHPDVLSVSANSAVPSDIRPIVPGRAKESPESEDKVVVRIAVDYDYIKTLEVDIMEGRNFSKEFLTDETDAFLINEAVVRELGLESPVGKRLIVGNREGAVIGVYKDLHFEPKRREIAPMVLYMQPERCFKLAVRISPQNIPKTLALLENKWEENIKNRPFQYVFLEEMVGDLYQSEERLSRVVKYFTFLAIFIACLGLFGLASFTAEQRTKEIGIRKVLGASVSGVVMLLSKEFAKLIIIANIIAWPLTFFIMRDWLQNFYYRITIGLEPFLLSAALVLLIAFVSISYQTIKAALSNPANSLRYE